MADALSGFRDSSKKSLEHLRSELSKLQTGRASSALVEHIHVEMYGDRQPMKNIASISIPDNRTISIQPWDKSALSAIEKAIMIADIGVNPVNNGVTIMLNLPSMTEERRRDLVKICKTIGEDTKISLRQARQAGMDTIKRDEALSEDMKKGLEKQLQELVDKANKDIEAYLADKEQEIMKI
ncbi:ribosome recycling factor [Candidatus Gracilibacteria bacterium CG17_big_fil_post_rev_8_21_14_2_50_48_13]|nr:MAG: ribosome recycling factor [Candidatus Gracilibacteria bacterium CG17_big_fil_post_rev_8_21_14_2_50_48_13]